MARHTPSSAHEAQVDQNCSARSVYELCSTAAHALPTIYLESDYHDTTGGADHLTEHHRGVSNHFSIYVWYGIDCYLFGTRCP